jgi:hypothetical protein
MKSGRVAARRSIVAGSDAAARSERGGYSSKEYRTSVQLMESSDG